MLDAVKWWDLIQRVRDVFQPVYHIVYTVMWWYLMKLVGDVFQPVYHTVYTVMWWYLMQLVGDVFQPVYHTVYTSPTRWIKTRHITASSVTPHRLDNFIFPEIFIINHFNLYLYYFCNSTEIRITFNCYDVTTTQLTAFVPLNSCNNTTLKMVAIAVETCWWENCD